MFLLAILLLNGLLLTACNNNYGHTGNAAALKKIEVDTIVNKFARHPKTYDSTKTYIYLTFDDGPQHGTTAVFELCQQLGVKASFFMVGQHAKDAKLQGIVANIRNAYPQSLLCNHSTTHASGHYQYFYHHPYMALEDFLLAQQTLNVPYKIIRLPGNSAWVLKDSIKASGLVHPICQLLDSAAYNVTGWDVEWSFNHKTANPVQTPQRMANMVDSALAHNHTHQHNHLVILSHDRMFRNPNYTDSLAKFITLLKQNPHFVFETVDNYPGVKIP